MSKIYVGNLPFSADEEAVRQLFSQHGTVDSVALIMDRETGRPRGFAFVEFLDRSVAEQAIERFNQQPFMGRSLSVSEARPREERPGGFSGPRPGGGFGGPRPTGPGGGFGGPRPGSPGGFSSGGPGASQAPAGNQNFGPPKKKGGSSDKRWEAKDRGPKGPIKERYTGRLGGLYDDPGDDVVDEVDDFDDVASRADDDEN